MNNFGHVIKLERVRKNMKQITLAQGICTPSYLSKIENNSIVPSQEVIELLLKRLELSISQNKNLNDESYLKQIREIYFNAVMNKDRELAAIQLKEINTERYLFSDSTNYYTYQLMVLRLTLIVQDIRHDTSELIMALSELSGNFNEYQMFLFNSCVGSYYSFKLDFNSTLQAYEKAITYSQKVNMEKWEEADFHYQLGHCYITQQRWVISIEYIQKSLEFFKNGFFNTRVVECHLMLAVAQDNSYQYEKAYQNLLLAQKIASQLNLKEHFPIITQNLGNTASVRGHSDKAIQYFLESLESRKDNDEKLPTIYSLVKEYSKLKNSQQIIKWAKFGLSLINENQNPGFETFSHHFNVYLARETDQLLFEKTTINAYNFFREIKDYRHTEKYSLLLGNFYYKNSKYKNAAKYFALSNENMFKKNKISCWEDL
ncbi:helix-turn-helix domain-containing protein [Paenisporosarcina antarctica]|uniref:XRE family transcriptional regulator n=1 Tax=Paenisporosarcina antarctica TaxID=417367 RepID=A0A4P6ZYB1_9BACL|nr:helix-turn-helix transcriptional regulator [Paenisporosarcina antarctica]QBP40456.1 XRE family transcriptional regulator [Paenisporosarcina antarctica]